MSVLIGAVAGWAIGVGIVLFVTRPRRPRMVARSAEGWQSVFDLQRRSAEVHARTEADAAARQVDP